MVSVQQKVVAMPQQLVIPSSSSILCGLSEQTTSRLLPFGETGQSHQQFQQ